MSFLKVPARRDLGRCGSTVDHEEDGIGPVAAANRDPLLSAAYRDLQQLLDALSGNDLARSRDDARGLGPGEVFVLRGRCLRLRGGGKASHCHRHAESETEARGGEAERFHDPRSDSVAAANPKRLWSIRNRGASSVGRVGGTAWRESGRGRCRRDPVPVTIWRSRAVRSICRS